MRLIDIRKDELPALAWAALGFACVLAAYYTLRPVRETFGVSVGRQQLAWWFTATFACMVLATPFYGVLVARVERRRLIPAVYGFFIVNLLAFWVVFSQGAEAVPVWARSVFYVWLSVFNLFVVSLFWSMAVDVFSGGQAKRLFGLIAGAGTAGGALGSVATEALARHLPVHQLLWVPMLLLGVAIGCSYRLRQSGRSAAADEPSQTAGGPLQHGSPLPEGMASQWKEAWSGVRHIGRSPYLGGIAGLMVLLSVLGTGVYFQMMELVAEAIPSAPERTAWFARLNAIQLGTTLLLQTAAASWLIRRLGLAVVLATVPVVYLAGFSAVWLSPALAVLAVFDVAHRVATFSLGVPSREVLFTMVPKEQKYRAKVVIDTVGKRAGDVVAAHGYVMLRSIGWLPAQVALAMLPLALIGVWLSVMLGTAHREATRIVDAVNRS